MSRLGSPQAASRRVAIAKPKNDIYVALLAIALCVLLIGCLLLFLEFNEYGRSTTPNVSQAVPGATAPSSIVVVELANTSPPIDALDTQIA